MKKSTQATKQLRARTLDPKKLEKVHGGRGICHGSVQCSLCHYWTQEPWGECPMCGLPFDR